MRLLTGAEVVPHGAPIVATVKLSLDFVEFL